jgi:hypothetical protein
VCYQSRRDPDRVAVASSFVRTTSRRKLDIALITGGTLVVGAAALVGGVVGNTERVTRYWTAAEVGSDGAAQVTEAIDYNFGAIPTDKHGIFRWVPGLSTSAAIAVESPDAPDDVDVSSQTRTRRDGTQVAGAYIRIGDAGTTVSGRHRYQIGYELPDVRQGDTVDWEAVGTEWEVGMDDVEVHLVTPFDLDGAGCFAGGVGSSGPCDIRQVEPGHVVATVDSLDAGEGVSIEGRVGAPISSPPAVPAPPTGAPDDPGTGLLPPAGTAAAAAALAAVPTALLVRRAGRERVAPGGAADAAFGGGTPLGGSRPWPEAPPSTPAVPPPPAVPGAEIGSTPTSAAAPAPAGTQATWAPPANAPIVSEIRVDADELAQMATTEFAPPSGISPAQGGIVLREEVRNEHKVAWLIQAAIDGVIDLDDRDGTTIRRIAGAPASTEQQAVLGRMFVTGPVIELGSYDKDFASGWGLVGTQLDAWRKTSDLWDAGADARRVLVRVLGIVAGVAGVAVAALGGVLAGRLGAPWLLLALAGGLLAGGGLAAAVGAWELHVRTPAGSALWLRTESFRRFLAGSEAYHAEEAAKRGVLREYTAWALAVGEIDRWSRAVKASTIAPEVAGVHYAYMAPLLLASTVSAATAPSSSGGSGGFGGGSVGGGAGGGGGGSW